MLLERLNEKIYRNDSGQLVVFDRVITKEYEEKWRAGALAILGTIVFAEKKESEPGFGI